MGQSLLRKPFVSQDLHLRDTAKYHTEFELMRELALQQDGTEENGQSVKDGTLHSFAIGPLGKM